MNVKMYLIAIRINSNILLSFVVNLIHTRVTRKGDSVEELPSS